MAHRNAFVSEDPAHLVYAVDSTDDELLERQLQCDAKVEVLAQSVVMGDERPRGRPARLRLQYRGLNLDVALILEETTRGAHNRAAQRKRPANLVVRDEVEVPLTVASLHIHQSVPLLRQRPQ